MLRYLTCRHTSHLISERLERSLSWFEWLCLRVHLLGCEPCCRFGRAVRWLHRALASAPSDEQLSAEARSRLRRALQEAAKAE
jgi:hypothetical protein